MARGASNASASRRPTASLETCQPHRDVWIIAHAQLDLVLQFEEAA